VNRRPAFVPSRLEDETDDLLPPPTNLVFKKKAPPQRPSRGRGGRPVVAVDGLTIVAVRIPQPLYDELRRMIFGVEAQPSYAQVVAWTCEDYQDEAVAELTHALQIGARAPRGRKAVAGNVAPLTLRFRAPELAVLDEMIVKVGGEASRVTRTAGVIAALRVAVKQGIKQGSGDA
jgi:hypothetical protein